MGRDSGGGASDATTSSGGATSAGGSLEPDAKAQIVRTRGIFGRAKKEKGRQEYLPVNTVQSQTSQRSSGRAGRCVADAASVVLKVEGDTIFETSFDGKVIRTYVLQTGQQQSVSTPQQAGRSPPARRAISVPVGLPASNLGAAPSQHSLSPATPAAAAVPVTPGPGASRFAEGAGLAAGPPQTQGRTLSAFDARQLLMQAGAEVPSPDAPSAPPAPAPDAPNLVPSPGAGAWTWATARQQQHQHPLPDNMTAAAPQAQVMHAQQMANELQQAPGQHRSTVHMQVMDAVVAEDFVRMMQGRQ